MQFKLTKKWKGSYVLKRKNSFDCFAGVHQSENMRSKKDEMVLESFLPRLLLLRSRSLRIPASFAFWISWSLRHLLCVSQKNKEQKLLLCFIVVTGMLCPQSA